MSHLTDWQVGDGDLHLHFEHDFAQWWWGDVAREGKRVYEETMNVAVEPESILDDILHAVAAQAASGAFSAVAAALGVEPKYLESALSDWYEEQEHARPPVGPEGLMRAVAREKKYWEEYERSLVCEFDENRTGGANS